jgi:hypothetical protein
MSKGKDGIPRERKTSTDHVKISFDALSSAKLSSTDILLGQIHGPHSRFARMFTESPEQRSGVKGARQHSRNRSTGFQEYILL